VVVGGDSAARERIHHELAWRYSTDYQIVTCDYPPGLAAQLQALRAAGTPAALVVGGVGGQDPDGIEVFAAVRPVEPTALRVAAVRWGDWAAAQPVFDALTLGKIDHMAVGPEACPDEEFHRSITEFLSEWSSRRDGGFEAVRLIGEQWSVRSQELRDVFTRYQIPAGFYDVGSARGREMLGELGLVSPELPVVVLRFAAQRSVLANPRTSRSPRPSACWRRSRPTTSATWRWSAPARRAWPWRSTRRRKACAPWWWRRGPSAARRPPAR
jgi:thioredoxin reductase (NADPH)